MRSKATCLKLKVNEGQNLANMADTLGITALKAPNAYGELA